MERQTARVAAFLVVMIVIWEVVGRFTGWGQDCFPAPGRILGDLWTEREMYAAHAAATARVALTGFCIGNAFAIGAAFLFCLFPPLEQIMRGVNITLFALPVIVLGPILVLILDGSLPQIVTSSVTVYFPSMAACLVGLREIDPRLSDVVRAYGGDKLAEMRFIRLRSALPSAFAGLRVASSLAVLGAILGEFGSGGRWGLGSYLLGSLGQGNAARLWGIGLAGTALALVGYGLFALLGQRVARSTVAVTAAASLAAPPSARHPWPLRVLVVAASILMPFLLWGGLVGMMHLSPIIAPGPLDTAASMLAPAASEARATLLSALAETIPVAALGLFAGLAAALSLALLSVLLPSAVRAIMPAALVLQSTPLVTLAPIVLLIFGRNTLASVVMTVLVVFFPAFVLLVEGFRLVPPGMKDLVAAYGGSRWQELRFVSLRQALPYLLVAAKLVAPRALLGVMISEWLLTGVGLGNLLNTARGQMDYDMVWGGATASIILSVLAYQGVSAVERLARPVSLR